ncbi:hypothetical protein TNIN_100351 [Trichonephila inaurata madagascariensis]|uniref:Uncharacterized protein n=1 Tax=Trichonephila inaurata madagascariensis TaxID=2747483 RepID=A0A8X6YE56_9ARAC|nr:hypothetical protein TNIN_100351 [Trichonephila inaurata madagascariensis]
MVRKKRNGGTEAEDKIIIRKAARSAIPPADLPYEKRTACLAYRSMAGSNKIQGEALLKSSITAGWLRFFKKPRGCILIVANLIGFVDFILLFFSAENNLFVINFPVMLNEKKKSEIR